MIRALALGLMLATPALADPAETARAAALQMLAAVEALAAAQGARDQVAALTTTIAAHEAGLEALRAGLRDAGRREAVLAAAFDARSVDTTRLLAAMTAMGRVQGPALLLHPAGPLGTARAGILVDDLAPAMQEAADRLGAALAELRDLRAARQQAVDTLTAGLASLQTARIDLSQAIAERRTLPPPIGQDEARLLALLDSAQTLDRLATGLTILPESEAPGAPGLAAARGRLPPPVRGTVRLRAGQADAAGTTRPGLVLATAPGALVQSPWDSTVRYRGPLIDYGNVILLEPDEGYLLLIAGLEIVYPRIGEIVTAGAPVGMMPGTVPTLAEFADLEPRSAVESETMYLEMRYRGLPIDPGDWFALNGMTP